VGHGGWLYDGSLFVTGHAWDVSDCSNGFKDDLLAVRSCSVPDGM
jgi:hypothetical protein